jgi:transcription elongation factor Elf1
MKCPECNSYKVEECYNAHLRAMHGWWCRNCGHFEKAIGRERIVVNTYGVPPPDEYPEIEPTKRNEP